MGEGGDVGGELHAFPFLGLHPEAFLFTVDLPLLLFFLVLLQFLTLKPFDRQVFLLPVVRKQQLSLQFLLQGQDLPVLQPVLLHLPVHLLAELIHLS